MRRLLILCFLLILPGFPDQSVVFGKTSARVQTPRWESFEPAVAGFRIEFPARPEFTFEKRSFERVTRRCNLTWGTGTRALLLRIESHDYGGNLNPETAKANIIDGDQVVDEMARRLGGNIKDSKLLKLDGCPARSVRIASPTVSALVVMAIGKSKYYTLQVVSQTAELLDSAMATRFLNSFEVRSSEPGGLTDGSSGGPSGGVTGQGQDSDQPLAPTSEWIDFETDDKVFSLKLPQKPKLSETEHEVLGKVKRIGCREVRGGKVVSYAVNYNPVKSVDVAGIQKRTITEDNLSKTYIEKTGGEILSSQIIMVDGYPARRVVIFNKETGILSVSLILVTDTHFFNLAASSSFGKEESEARLDFFLKSLKIKTKEK